MSWFTHIVYYRLKVLAFCGYLGMGADIGFRLPNLELMFRMVGVNILIVSYRG